MSNVISEKQQKSTLRGKKGRKETIKNVLASPYTHYWPLINNEDANKLKQILSNLPKIKEPTKIPWEDIKKIPREERREYRKKILNLDTKPIDPAPKYMYFGINEVTKLLERNEAVSVLLTHDVTPQLMIKHIVDLCVFKQAPILVVSNLKPFLKKTVGIGSVAVAFKKNIQCESKVNLICTIINDIFVNYPVPKTHACYPNVDKSFFVPSKSETIDKNDPAKEEKPIENVYLYRNSSQKGRVFVPKSSNEKETAVDKMEIDTSGFLSFTDDNVSVSEKSVESSYRSLIVKRIRNNPDRMKQKLDMLKNKKRKKRKRELD